MVWFGTILLSNNVGIRDTFFLVLQILCVISNLFFFVLMVFLLRFLCGFGSGDKELNNFEKSLSDDNKDTDDILRDKANYFINRL